MKNLITLNIAILMLLTGCNTPPSRIAPLYQSSDQYEHHDCKKLNRTLNQLDATISAQRSQLQTDATIDTGIVAGSLIFLPLGLIALAATGNSDLRNEYAKNLGKQSALRETIESKGCEG